MAANSPAVSEEMWTKSVWFKSENENYAASGGFRAAFNRWIIK